MVIRVVPTWTPDAAEIAALQGRMRASLGEDVECRVVPVRDLALGPGGKLRVDRSTVHSHYDEIRADGVSWP